MAKDSATSLGTLADVIRELYGPGSKYDREALALREPVVRRALE